MDPKFINRPPVVLCFQTRHPLRAWHNPPSPGNIPESLRYLQKLTKIDLAHNMFEGSVPGGDARWTKSMSIILLNNCKLSGEGNALGLISARCSIRIRLT